EQLELLLLELVQVRDVGDELRLEQRPHPLVPETTDVHRPATREVHDALEDPPRARHVRAIDHHFVLRTLHLRTAHWTLVRRLEALPVLPRRTTFGGRGAAQHLRDDLAGARDFHQVTGQAVLRRDQLEVAERGGGHCYTTALHRLET